MVVIIAFVVLHYTRMGRTVYGIGNGGNSAMLMGLPVTRTKILVYAISGLCAAIAGVLFTLYTRSGYSLAAVGMELDAIAAVVIGGALLTGGYGFVLGSVLGRAAARHHPDPHHVRRHAELVVDAHRDRRAAAGVHRAAAGADRTAAVARRR